MADIPPDPVKHCAQYRDKDDGSCAHVDGPDCDMRTCAILKNYHWRKALEIEANPLLGSFP